MEAFGDVLAAAREGAEWAWGRIYGELAPSVAGYLRAHGAADPEDLAGEVFLQVVRGLPRFDGDEPGFRSWVFTIAHRRLVDDARRRARRRVDLDPPGRDARDDAAAVLDGIAVRTAIAGLPGDQRAVLLLRILGDLTIDEIAGVLGKRPGAVKALQRRAVRRLEGAYPSAVLERLP